mgnify:CR=1 FL=1|tara:strand:- start:4400 stop:4690 length:291 start_codon:yes stop_codon:yes gene_type:complete
MIRVKYECDLLGDHTAPIINLCETDTVIFNDRLKALIFIQECTSPITKEYEICPWIAKHLDIFAENRIIEYPFSNFKNEIANIHLILNEQDFKTLS